MVFQEGNFLVVVQLFRWFFFLIFYPHSKVHILYNDTIFSFPPPPSYIRIKFHATYICSYTIFLIHICKAYIWHMAKLFPHKYGVQVQIYIKFAQKLKEILVTWPIWRDKKRNRTWKYVCGYCLVYLESSRQLVALYSRNKKLNKKK